MRLKAGLIALAAIAFAACNSTNSIPGPQPTPFSGGPVNIFYRFASGEGQSIKPQAPLILHDNTLYGTTVFTWTKHSDECCGTVFSLSIDGKITVMHRFKLSEGAHPRAGLLWYNGRLWGTTSNGGAGCGLTGGCGTVFSVNGQTGQDFKSYQFQGGGSDGAFPYGGLVEYRGMLYGTTVNGGSGRCGTLGCGTIFQLNPSTYAEKPIHNFDGSKGAYPYAGLTVYGSKLYGTTAKGGDACGGLGCGTIFYYDVGDSRYNAPYRFDGEHGDDPRATLEVRFLANRGFSLLGTTVNGGDNNAGTLFAYSIAHNQFWQSYSLEGGDKGRYPYGSLLEYRGLFYGTTAGSGGGCGRAIGCGTLFRWDPVQRTFKTLHVFKGDHEGDGEHPLAGLVETRGSLYGTTEYGGKQCSSGCGTVFSITP